MGITAFVHSAEKAKLSTCVKSEFTLPNPNVSALTIAGYVTKYLFIRVHFNICGLEINVEKTKYMLLSRHQNVFPRMLRLSAVDLMRYATLRGSCGV
jgi:hypothetical protein